ncbi:MAG: hypothetical protein ACP5Q3_14195 [bacterium]
MKKGQKKLLLPGTIVRIKSLPEIMSTLDKFGKLEGLPFMPEMAKYCGKIFLVSRRLERTCEESERGMRRIKNVVFLDNLRCDGSAHGGCQKRCFIFWKEDWLSTEFDKVTLSESHNNIKELIAQLPAELPDGSFICQSTELVHATTPISLFDFMCYIRDIRSKTYSIPELIKVLLRAFFLRVRYYLTGIPFRYLKGNQKVTPSQSLNLQPGEWVRVKTKDEIRATLDINGMNRGLRFTLDMLPYCGKVYRVLDRLERMIYEPTRRIVTLKDTVILEDSICRGCHIIKGGCPRANYNFWREIWLERITDPEHSNK